MDTQSDSVKPTKKQPDYQYDLREQTYVSYAVQSYTRPLISQPVFVYDLKRIQYAKRLLSKYARGNKIKLLLLINHITSIVNAFGKEQTCTMLFFRCGPESYSALKTIMVYLGYIKPDLQLKAIGINCSDINIDELMLNDLQQFLK